MKKILPTLICLTFLSLQFLVPVSAAPNDIASIKIESISTRIFTDKSGQKVLEKISKNKQGDIIEVSVEKGEYATAVNTGDFSTQAIVYYAASRSTVTSRLEFGWAQLRIYANGFSDSYTSSSKTSKKAIDKISVNTTLLMNGSVEDQDTDNRTNSSFANTSAAQQSWMVPTAPQYSRSSHAYHHSGANSVYHSTEAKR